MRDQIKLSVVVVSVILLGAGGYSEVGGGKGENIGIFVGSSSTFCACYCNSV